MPYLYVLAAVVLRLMPHPWNMTPMAALFLFSGATFRSKRDALLVPLGALLLSDFAVIQFLWTWNDFLWPLVVISSDSHTTLQLGLSSFQGAHSTQWALLMAGAVMSQIPVLALFFICQRWFVQSVALSGLK